MTRDERRAIRRLRFVTAREARMAARLARLDYKVSGETGAMRVPTKSRTWHQGGRLNGHVPPPGLGWERYGATYVRGDCRTGLTAQADHPSPMAEADGTTCSKRHNRITGGDPAKTGLGEASLSNSKQDRRKGVMPMR